MTRDLYAEQPWWMREVESRAVFLRRMREQARRVRALSHPDAALDRCWECGVEAPLSAEAFVMDGWTFTYTDWCRREHRWQLCDCDEQGRSAVLCPADHDDVVRMER